MLDSTEIDQICARLLWILQQNHDTTILESVKDTKKEQKLQEQSKDMEHTVPEEDLEERTEETFIENPEEKTAATRGEAVLIGIVGTKRGIGSTHICIQYAESLAIRGYRIAVIEKHSQESGFLNINQGQAEYFTGIDGKMLEEIAFTYDFIFFDFGLFDQCERSLFRRCDKKLIVTGTKPWEAQNINAIFQTIPSVEIERYYYIFNHVPEKQQPTIKQGMEPIRNIYFAEYIVDPWEGNGAIEKEIFAEYQDMKAEKTSESKKERKKLWSRKKQK